MSGRFLIAVLILAAVAAITPARAQETLTVVEDLSFGTFGLRDNDNSHDVTVGIDNTPFYDTAIVDGPVPPQRGEYLLEGLPPNLALGVTIDDTTLSLDGSGDPPLFTMSDGQHNNPVTDGAGTAMLYVGATLSTSGTGVNYPSGHYEGGYDLTIVF